MPLTTAQMRDEWAEYKCNSKDWLTVTVLNRAPVKIVTKLRDAWARFDAVMYANGYGDAAIVSSYACRLIAGSTRYSLHSYRVAIDVDPTLNGRQGSGSVMDWSRCKLTRQQSDAVEAIRTVSGAQVFTAGWRFNNPDPMHFQICCTQTDIASGIKENDMPTYRTVQNVPEKQWAKDVVDWGIDSGVIITSDSTPDDWANENMTDGRMWTMLSRLPPEGSQGPKGDRGEPGEDGLTPVIEVTYQ